MELNEKHCWAEISIDAIKNNYNIIKAMSDFPFYTVVKADAYGHGAKYISQVYRSMGTFGFCVSSYREAIELRKNGITKPILILGYTDPHKAYDLFKNNLTQTVISLEYAKQLNDNALYPIDCHVKLDTGMGRLGFDLIGEKEKSYSEIKQLLELSNLRFTGMFSHFPVADSVGEKELMYTQRQIDLFDETAKEMEKWGFNLRILHGQNSAGIARRLNGPFNTMRAGIILYGQQPSDEVILPGLEPCMDLKTIVTHIKTIHPGQSVGYGIHFTADKETKVATIAAGYADGVPRLLSFTGHNVEINGRYYPVIGNICMDQLMIDITGSDVQIGDEVLVIGGKGQCSYQEVADKTHTITHELMCDVAKRVPRVYTENGRIVHIEYGI